MSEIVSIPTERGSFTILEDWGENRDGDSVQVYVTIWESKELPAYEVATHKTLRGARAWAERQDGGAWAAWAQKKTEKRRREEQAWAGELHCTSDGEYRVGGSPLFVRRHAEGDWGVYSWSAEGPLRIRGVWAFRTLQEARERALAVAREYGWADEEAS